MSCMRMYLSVRVKSMGCVLPAAGAPGVCSSCMRLARSNHLSSPACVSFRSAAGHSSCLNTRASGCKPTAALIRLPPPKPLPTNAPARKPTRKSNKPFSYPCNETPDSEAISLRKCSPSWLTSFGNSPATYSSPRSRTYTCWPCSANRKATTAAPYPDPTTTVSTRVGMPLLSLHKLISVSALFDIQGMANTLFDVDETKRV